MPAQKRYKTKYPGIYFIEGKAVASQKMERIYYMMYRKEGKQIVDYFRIRIQPRCLGVIRPRIQRAAENI